MFRPKPGPACTGYATAGRRTGGRSASARCSSRLRWTKPKNGCAVSGNKTRKGPRLPMPDALAALPRIDCLPHLECEVVDGEGLGQECRADIDDAIVPHGVARVAGRIEDFQSGAEGQCLVRELAAGHLGHDDV